MQLHVQLVGVFGGVVVSSSLFCLESDMKPLDDRITELFLTKSKGEDFSFGRKINLPVTLL